MSENKKPAYIQVTKAAAEQGWRFRDLLGALRKIRAANKLGDVWYVASSFDFSSIQNPKTAPKPPKPDPPGLPDEKTCSRCRKVKPRSAYGTRVYPVSGRLALKSACQECLNRNIREIKSDKRERDG